jgi:hypothetical protein
VEGIECNFEFDELRGARNSVKSKAAVYWKSCSEGANSIRDFDSLPDGSEFGEAGRFSVEATARTHPEKQRLSLSQGLAKLETSMFQIK